MSAREGGEDHHIHSKSSRRRVPDIPIPSVARPATGVHAEIKITDNDVLSGRGISIASHVGCIRFRKLVSSHRDANYCSDYNTIEKRAVADKIIAHIQSLNPPGRFLKKTNNSKSNKLDGPWEELTYEQALKKTVQALRDANREDREGYAEAAPVPEDVKQHRAKIERQGLTNRQFAKKAAIDFVAKIQDTPTQQSIPNSDPSTSLPPSPPDVASVGSSQWTNSSPEFASAATAVASYARLPSVTPSTAARPTQPLMALFEDDRKMPARDDFYHSSTMPPSPTGEVADQAFPDSPHLDSGEETFASAFGDATSGPNPNDPLDVMAARAAAGLEHVEETSLHHHPHDPHDPHPHHHEDDYPNLFHEVDDVDLSTANDFEDPKY